MAILMHSLMRISAPRWEMGNKFLDVLIPGQAIKLSLTFSSILLVAISLSGCISLNDAEVSQEHHTHIVGTITENQSIGQTFTVRQRNLDNLQIWYYIDPNEAAENGSLTATLYHADNDQSPIRTYTIGQNRLINRNTLSIPFQIRDDLPDQSYYVELTVNGGVIHIYGRDEDAYPEGDFYLDRTPQMSDIGFRISYYYDSHSLLEDISTLLDLSFLVLPLVLMLWIPGRIIVELLPINKTTDWGERTALAIGISMALIPILMLWTSTLNIRLQRELIFAVYIFLALVYVWMNKGKLIQLFKRSSYHIDRNLIIPSSLVIIFCVTLVTRVAMVRDMVAPAWVDSVHHAMLTELIVEQGGFPDSYAPYISIENPTYHPGFHSIAAIFQWLTNLQVHQTLLIFGQIINSLSIFSVYLFTNSFTKNRFAAIIAALITGVITPMPAYYTSWGRYTQLAGLIIFPAAYYLLTYRWNLERGSVDRYHDRVLKKPVIVTFITASILLGGLYLVHYRVTAFLFTLIIAVLIVRAASAIARRQERDLIENICDLLIVGACSLVITLPWWPESLTSLIIPRMSPASGSAQPFSDFSWFLLTAALGSWALIAAGIGVLIGIWQRKSYILSIVLWILILFVLANLEALSLPGGGMINNTSVAIMLFFPISMLAGMGVVWLAEFVRSWIDPPWKYALITSFWIIALIVMVLGAQSIIPIINPITILVREADLPAMDWIAENIPQDKVIAINPFNWGYGLYAGNDGGYWLSPLAGRISLPPPVLYGLNPEIGAPIVQISSQIYARSGDVGDLHSYLLENGIEYIFIGARGGIFSPRDMQASPLYNEIYNHKGTWVFQLVSSDRSF